jgi:hypothetical protein
MGTLAPAPEIGAAFSVFVFWFLAHRSSFHIPVALDAPSQQCTMPIPSHRQHGGNKYRG